MFVCFLAGAAWPALSGVEFAPRPPGLGKRRAFDLLPPDPPDPAEEEGPDGLPAIGLASASRRRSAFTQRETTRVQRTLVVSCGDTQEGSVQQCDEPNVSAHLEVPLQQLARCSAAEGASGLLSLGMRLDFRRGHITHVKVGQSTTLSSSRAAALVACAENVVVGTPLRGIAHRHRYYWLYYLTEFVPPGSPIDESEAEPPLIVPMSGYATVGWDSATARKRPGEQSPEAFELPFGTRVQVVGRLDDWYQVQPVTGPERGWVHRTALGL